MPDIAALVTPPLLLDSTGAPANGDIFSRVTSTIAIGAGLVTPTQAHGSVTDGQIKALDQTAFNLPVTPEGVAVELYVELREERPSGSGQSRAKHVIRRTVSVPDQSTVTWDELVDVIPVATDGDYMVPTWVTELLGEAAAAAAPAIEARDAAIDAQVAAEAAAASVPSPASISSQIGTAVAPKLDASVAASTYAALSANGLQALETQRSFPLLAWSAALANRDNAPAKTYHIGDSITEWAYTTALDKRWTTRLNSLLRSRFPTAGIGSGGGVGFLPPYIVGPGPQPCVTVGTPGTDTTFGIGRRCSLMVVGNTKTYTFTGTSFKLHYVQGPSTGSMGVQIDGGSVTTVATSGTLSDGKEWASPALTAGAHTVTISVISSTVYFTGIDISNGDEAKGIRAYEGGHWGWKSGDYMGGANSWLATLTQLQPHLVTVALGTNDYQAQVPVATYKATLTTLVGYIKANITADPSIVFIAWPERTDVVAPTIPWASYVGAMKEIAAADSSVSVLDFTNRVAGPAVSNGLGLWYDQVHPTDKGAALLADVIAGYLMPR